MESGFSVGKISSINNIINRKVYNPGSLGLEIYCFANDYISAFLFTKRRNNEVILNLLVIWFTKTIFILK